MLQIDGVRYGDATTIGSGPKRQARSRIRPQIRSRVSFTPPPGRHPPPLVCWVKPRNLVVDRVSAHHQGGIGFQVRIIVLAMDLPTLAQKLERQDAFTQL